MSRVLVTGASGYIALHVVDLLLKQGHKVRGTVRNLKDEHKIAPIKKLNTPSSSSSMLELVEAELLNEDSLKKAVQDTEYVVHIASPLPITNPVDENEVIKPALEGTLNVLQAAFNAKTVKRVIVTSSGLAIAGYKWEEKNYTEQDWPNPDLMPMAYGKSKVLAERAAWDFVDSKKKNNESCFDLVVIHPLLVLGPVLSGNVGSSVNHILKVLNGTIEKLPNVYYPTCDVRDVALAHVKALVAPDAVGHRHIIASSTNFIPIKLWADVLNEKYGPQGFKIPLDVERTPPNGEKCTINDSRMRNVLGITPTDLKKTVLDMAESLIAYGLASPKKA